MSENNYEGMSEEELMRVLTTDWGPGPFECECGGRSCNRGCE